MRKYLSIIILALAILLLLWIKYNQEAGKVKNENVTLHRKEFPFDRHSSKIEYSLHAKCRMECRHIDETEIREILDKGKLNYSRIQKDERGKTYPIEGITKDGQNVRLVIAPHDDKIVVVTVIDLGKEWMCNCD